MLFLQIQEELWESDRIKFAGSKLIMTDERQSITENLVAEIKPEAMAFKNEIVKANGTLIPLTKTTKDGKRLYITVRYIRRNSNEDVNRDFYGWNNDLPKTGVLLVDTYMGIDTRIIPVGHLDWWLNNDYANGGAICTMQLSLKGTTKS